MNKKLVCLLLFFSVLAAGTWFISKNGKYKLALRSKSAPTSIQKDEDGKEKTRISPQNKFADEKDKLANKKSKEEKKQDKEEKNQATASNSRGVASVPKGKDKKNWSANLSRRLTNQLKAYQAKPKIKSLGSSKIKIQSSFQDVEHVLISIDKGNGNVSSYEAYIHPKTGSVLRTWNQTRFEFREPLALKLKPFRPSP
ncbi:MAG: hypothetical protein WD025_00685 [Bacteriovoracaceae bacterium]